MDIRTNAPEMADLRVFTHPETAMQGAASSAVFLSGGGSCTHKVSPPIRKKFVRLFSILRKRSNLPEIEMNWPKKGLSKRAPNESCTLSIPNGRLPELPFQPRFHTYFLRKLTSREHEISRLPSEKSIVATSAGTPQTRWHTSSAGCVLFRTVPKLESELPIPCAVKTRQDTATYLTKSLLPH